MSDFERKSRETYNEKAHDYDSSPEGQFTESYKKLLFDKVKLKDGDRVLDVACGNGKLLQMLNRKAGIEAYGVDISENMIENAKKNAPNMVFETAGCENIPFEEDSFDVITVSASYHHFPRVDLFAKEASRLLKPNGCIYIAELLYPWLIRKIATPFLRLSSSGDYKIYSPEEIIKTFSSFWVFKEVGVNKGNHPSGVS